MASACMGGCMGVMQTPELLALGDASIVQHHKHDATPLGATTQGPKAEAFIKCVWSFVLALMTVAVSMCMVWCGGPMHSSSAYVDGFSDVHGVP